MGIFTSYQITETDLILNEDIYGFFESNRLNSIRTWTLKYFDKESVTVEQLEKLINYNGDSFVEISQTIDKLCIEISPFFDSGEYSIYCKEYITEDRAYNVEELTQIIHILQNQAQTENKVLYHHQKFVSELNRMLTHEAINRERIIAEVTHSETILKAQAKLELNSQVRNLIAQFEGLI